MATLGFDTSNYTTSLAWYAGGEGENFSRLLEVVKGERGLRQSDALFQHVKSLPSLAEHLRQSNGPKRFSAIAASTRPREVEGSYMPCFLAGEGQARSLAALWGIPFFAVSHQQGHVAAAAWSAGRLDLLDRPHLAWHLSGGTTELLLVQPNGPLPQSTCIGGTTDISAGQLIDRSGVRMGLAFPAGKALDALSQEAKKALFFAPKVQNCSFSLSGLENKVQELLAQGEEPAEVAAFVLRSILCALDKATQQAFALHPALPLLCAGGVASNALLREALEQRHGAIFALPQYATDNALGVALLAERLWEVSSHV